MDSDPGDTRSSLLGRLRAGGDDDAWQEFDRRYRGLVIRYCLRRGLQVVDAEDVRQSVMIGLTRSLKQFRYDPARGRFRSYFGRVVQNAVTRFERTRRHEVSLEDVGETQSPPLSEDDRWVDEWRIHHLKLALDAVSKVVEPESLAVFERLIDGREVAEVAREFGNPAQGGRDLSIVEAVDKAAARVGKKFAGRPELEAAVRRSIGQVYHKLARYREAERELRLAVELWRRIPRAPATNRANANVSLAWTLVQRGMRDEARALLVEAREILKPLGPDGEPVLALVIGDLATLSVEHGKFAEAADLYRESLAIATRLGAESLEMARARQNLAVALLNLGKPAEARAELEPLLEIIDRSETADGIAWADTVLTNMGWAEVLDGRVDEGIKLLRRAAAISEKRYGSHPETASTLNMLARALLRAKELPEAEEVARRALAMHRAASGTPRRHLASAIAGLARTCSARGKQAEGEELMADAAAMYAAIGSREEAALATADLEAMRRSVESQPASRPQK